MDNQNYYKQLGETLVEKLRDKSFSDYLSAKHYASSISLTEFSEIPKNPNVAPELQKIDDNRFKLLNSLNQEQLETLDQLILRTLDAAAFYLLREMEENLDEEKSIGLTIAGQNIEVINKNFLSGTLFGEYFLWVAQYSKYGPFQQ